MVGIIVIVCDSSVKPFAEGSVGQDRACLRSVTIIDVLHTQDASHIHTNCQCM